MIKKVLIANRGEIAVRIIRACREMGIETVAVYSEADREALHTQLADEAVCIGPAAAKDSYLNMEQIISATIVSGADAIHPGFGFLSENSRFAELCEQCNITFIGPPSTVIASLGNKQAAKNTNPFRPRQGEIIHNLFARPLQGKKHPHFTSNSVCKVRVFFCLHSVWKMRVVFLPPTACGK